MVLNNIKTGVATTLVTVLAVASPQAGAQDVERTQHLGVVNGQVKDNQMVEVTRSLTVPVLYRVSVPDALPQTLRIRNATARPAEHGAVWVTTTRLLTTQRHASITAKATLWLDGKVVPVSWQQQGGDVLIHSPGAQHQVVLRSDSPVTLQVPANWRGTLQVPMEIAGE